MASWKRPMRNLSTDTSAVAAIADQELAPKGIDMRGQTATNVAVFPTSTDTTTLQFFGQDTNNDEIRLYIYYLSQIVDENPVRSRWHHTLVLTCDVLISTALTGDKDGVVGIDEYYCDSITASGSTPSEVVEEIYTPTTGDLGPAWVQLSTKYSTMIKVKGDLDAGAGTAGTAWGVIYQST